MTISQRVFHLLAKQGKKQNELSDFTGISTSTISAWNTRGTEKSSPTENLSENELEMLEVFQKFNEREQLKLIGKLEELLRQKQIKENQQPAAFKVARSSDGQFRKTELSAEELERIHNLPEDTDF